jgi:hypothetical protein
MKQHLRSIRLTIPFFSRYDTFGVKQSHANLHSQIIFTTQVPLFDAGHTTFIVPIQLYVHRMSSFLKAVKRDHGFQVKGFFDADGDEEDVEVEAFDGIVMDYPVRDSDLPAPHLSGSGYCGVRVKWESDETTDELCPWELSVAAVSQSSMSRPRLTDVEKRSVRRALAKIKGTESFDLVFGTAVDTKRYYDYLSRVEVPMDLRCMVTRLESDFYGSVFSIVADFQLIRDNCSKYNGENDELTLLATEMMRLFIDSVLTNEQKEAIAVIETAVRQNVASEGFVLTTAARGREHTKSVLERLTEDETHTMALAVNERRRQDRLKPALAKASNGNVIRQSIATSEGNQIKNSTDQNLGGTGLNVESAFTRSTRRSTALTAALSDIEQTQTQSETRSSRRTLAPSSERSELRNCLSNESGNEPKDLPIKSEIGRKRLRLAPSRLNSIDATVEDNALLPKTRKQSNKIERPIMKNKIKINVGDRKSASKTSTLHTETRSSKRIELHGITRLQQQATPSTYADDDVDTSSTSFEADDDDQDDDTCLSDKSESLQRKTSTKRQKLEKEDLRLHSETRRSKRTTSATRQSYEERSSSECEEEADNLEKSRSIKGKIVNSSSRKKISPAVPLVASKSWHPLLVTCK